MKEKLVTIGNDVKMAAVLAEPGAQTANRPHAFLLLNAGLIHRVGPHRLYVRIARQLAAAGYAALRFDLSGRGDNEVRRDGAAFLESSLAETRAAMDFLEQTTGARRFVLFGICSGAINSLQAAIADERVAGVIAVDGPAYPTTGHLIRRYAKRLMEAETWLNTLQGRNKLGRLLRGDGGASEREPNQFADLYGNAQIPPRSEAEAALRRVVNRGVRLKFIYTGSWSMYNYQNQFRDAFPDLVKTGKISVAYVPDSDHTFTSLHNQERLMSLIDAWVRDEIERA
jgi:dienelactone hydrolase